MDAGSVKIFRALSDRNRVRILKMLELRPLCVCEITSILELATSTVSKHLSILRDAGLLTDSKDGKWIYYGLSKASGDPHTREVLSLVSRWFDGDKTAKSDAEKARTIDKEKLCGV
jgi:ArsR family transcriptional regulator